MLSSFEQSRLSAYFTLSKGNKLFQAQERTVINHAFFSLATQREIIKTSRIPQQTISRIVKSLIKRKVLNQIGRESTGNRGQPSYFLECNPDYAYSIGIGILTDSLSLAVMDFKGNIILSLKRPLSNMSIKKVMANLRELFNQAINESGIQAEKILGLGVAISGYFIDYTNKINTHNRLNEWAKIDISKLISDEFHYPVWVENDATAAAAGEGIAGVGSTIENFVYLFISTGFGGGIIVNGNIMRGTHGNAGEVGDMIPPKLFIHPNLENLRQILIRNGVNIKTISELLEKFDFNWPGINEWIYKVKDALNLVASSAAALLDTQAIVIGGHIPEKLAKALIKEIEIYAQNRRSNSRSLPDILLAQTKFEPVSVGAASIPFRMLCL